MLVTTIVITAIATLVALVIAGGVVLSRARGILDDVSRIQAAVMPHLQTLQANTRIATEEWERISSAFSDAGTGGEGDGVSDAPPGER